MFDLFKRFAVIFAVVALVAAGATLAIAAKGGSTSTTANNAATTQYSGGTGCTPGYWKNNPGHWVGTGYSPSDEFDKVFGVTLFPGKTLLEVASTGGGGFEALGRHAVAALLNSATSTIGYKYSTAQVIKYVQEAVATKNPEPIKDALAAANESGCKLPADEASKPKGKK
jgi:hypothetical protein